MKKIAEAVAGERLGSEIRSALDARKKITFEEAEDDESRFENVGEEMSLNLKKFKLKIPERLSGRAKLLEGDNEGVVLRFDKRHSLAACKMFFCAKIQSIEITRHRIYVDLEGDSLDQCFELD